jgi:hypothetical protein
MLSDKRLFEIMIKYHQTFIGWLINKKKVEKLEDRLTVCKIETQEHEQTYIKEYKGEVCHTYNNGIRRIYSNWRGNPDFTKITSFSGSNIDDVIKRGFELFDIGNTSDIFCLTSQVENLLIKCYDIVGDINLPEKFPRFKGKAVSYYIKWLEHRHNFLKERNYRFVAALPQIKYIGHSGFSSDQPKVIENIIKHGIFAYRPIYKEIEWSFDLVEKYKDQIVWKLLMDESNLIWEEDKLIQYDKYIPYCIDGKETYCEMFESEEVFNDYTKLGFLSNEFLESHKEKLNWLNVFEKCSFNWNSNELKHFCNYALSIDLPYSVLYKGERAVSPIDLTILIDNKNFHWTSENLYAWLSISENSWEALVEKHRPKLFKLFLTIPNIKKIAEPHANDIKNFWEIICNENDFPYDELTQEFTIENIKRNIENWSIPLENKFLTERRTPDTNYSYYYVETQWDIFLKRRNIPLTYELAKFLLGINIKLGGTYMMTDGGYIEEDHRFPIFNGLEAFSGHHMASLQDCIKCLEDRKIADVLLHYANIDLIKLITDSFFKDYQIKDYINIINMLKDWYHIKKFYGDEE